MNAALAAIAIRKYFQFLFFHISLPVVFMVIAHYCSSDCKRKEAENDSQYNKRNDFENCICLQDKRFCRDCIIIAFVAYLRQ
jgi:hypothetical protein